jgi:hypothetical protein
MGADEKKKVKSAPVTADTVNDPVPPMSTRRSKKED